MTRCTNCETDFEGGGLYCPECLEELGLTEETIDHTGLMLPDQLEGEPEPPAPEA